MDTNTNLPETENTDSSIFTGAGDPERWEYEHGIKKARNALFVAGAIMFTVDVVIALINHEAMTDAYFWGIIGFDAVILGLFIGLGFWTKKKPYTAILTGLIIFCLIQILAMFADPTNIYKGIIVKVIVVITLVSGIKNARKLQHLNRAGL